MWRRKHNVQKDRNFKWKTVHKNNEFVYALLWIFHLWPSLYIFHKTLFSYHLLYIILIDKVSSACNQNNMICKYQRETMFARACTSVTLKTCLLNIAFVKSLILDNCCWLLWLFDLKQCLQVLWININGFRLPRGLFNLFMNT